MNRERMFFRPFDLVKKTRVLLGVCLVMLTMHTTHAQSYGTASGMPPFVAPEPVDLGFTDAANGNLHLEISLGSYPQRASKQPLDIKYIYDSNSIWTVACGQFSCSWWSPYQTTTVRRLSTALVSELAGINCGSNGACPEAVYQDQWGTSRFFPLQNTTCPIPTVHASDSSGYLVDWCNGKVYSPDGTLVESAGEAFKDTNGNSISFVADQDTLGRTFPTGCGQTCQLPNSQGGVSTYTITTATIPVQTEFGQSGVGEFAGSLDVLQSITLPDGTTYQFKYDCNSGTGNSACGSPSGQNGYYGLLTSIILPTGGTVSYGYTKFSDSYSNKIQWLSSRTSAGGTWTYSPQVISTCSSTQVGCQQKVTVTKPSGDYTVYTFTLNNGAWPVQVQAFQRLGTILSTVTNTYDFSNACPFSGCHGNSYIRLLTTQTSVPASAGGSITKQTQYTYDSPQTGNVTAVKEWRYYSGSFPTTPDRETDTTYLSTGTNDIDKPLSATIKNSSGGVIAQTLNTYDSYSGSCGGMAVVNGAVNHDDTNFGSGYTARGNPTQVQRLVSGSTYLTTTYCYDTTGQVTKELDPAGNITSYGYADNFYSDNGSNPPASYTPTQSTNAYMTSVTQPIIGTAHMGL